MKIRTAPLHDHLVDGDECVVLVDETVVHLSPIPTAIVALARDWTPVDVLAIELVKLFGEAPGDVDTRVMVGHVVGELSDQRIIEVAD